MFGPSKWRQQFDLELSSARRCLKSGLINDFPLFQLQSITDTHLLSPSRGKPVLRYSSGADIAIGTELSRFEGHTWDFPSALLATIHALSYVEARARLRSCRPDSADADEHFLAKLAYYLQVILLANRARPGICDEADIEAAEELFVMVRRGKRDDFQNMPVIWTVLRRSAQGLIDELLPLPLIEAAIRLSSYNIHFQRRVLRFQDASQWSKLYSLVVDAITLIDHPEILSLVLPTATFSYLLAWNPDSRRINLWASQSDVVGRYNTLPIRRLEGPDTTGMSHRALRYSFPGEYEHLNGLPLSEALYLLDGLLDLFDRAVMAGPAYVEWVASLCCQQPRLMTVTALSTIVASPLPSFTVVTPSAPSRPPATRVAPPAPAPAPPVVFPAPEPDPFAIWCQRDIGAVRTLLRTKLLHSLRDVPQDLVKACIDASFEPSCDDEFVRQLSNCLSEHTDPVCVRVANFLGPRVQFGSGQVYRCWSRLLMHMMRLQPPGMAERCSKELVDETWSSWQKNLGILYGEEHLSPDAGLGFTREGFKRLTEQRRTLSRRVSTLTATMGRSSPMHDADVVRSSSTATGRRPRRGRGGDGYV